MDYNCNYLKMSIRHWKQFYVVYRFPIQYGIKAEIIDVTR